MPSNLGPTVLVEGSPVAKAASRQQLGFIGTEINDGGFFVAGASPAERTTVSVLDFGADPTGATDSRQAIQDAIEMVGAAGGGTVYMPSGDYKVVNTDLGEAALQITHSNITLAGDGMNATRLFFRVFGDLDPATNWQLKNGGTEVHRGHGLRLGVASSPIVYRNIILHDFAYDGGAGYTGDLGWPADIVTGDGWDITHKAIDICSNCPGEDILLERLHIHKFRGEMIYRAGADDGKRITLRACWVEDSNSNGWNVLAVNGRCEGNLFSNLGQLGEFGVRGSGGTTFVNNLCEDCLNGLSIVGMFGFDSETTEPINPQVLVMENQFKRITNNAIKCAVGKTLIANNVVTDYGSVGILLHNSIQGMQKPIRDIHVVGNTLRTVAQTPSVGAINAIGSSTMPLQDIVIENNLIAVDGAGAASCPYAFVMGLTTNARNVVVRGNTVIGTNYFCRHQRNGGSNWNTLPDANAPMPLFLNNMDLSHGLSRHQTPAITVSGGTTDPIMGGRVRFSHSAAFAEPTIDPQYYEVGYRITVLGPTANAPTYIPRLSASFRCGTDRYLYEGCELDLEFDGTRLVEVGWRDGRAAADTNQTTGTILDTQVSGIDPGLNGALDQEKR